VQNIIDEKNEYKLFLSGGKNQCQIGCWNICWL